MDVIVRFGEIYWFYLTEIWLSLLAGFLISGFFNEFIPEAQVRRHLGEKGPRAIFIASLTGILLPVCCFGVLPIGVTLRRKGARLGPVLAFLVTTPATSASALFVCWKLLGPVFTAHIFLAVMVMGLILGWIGNAMVIPANHQEQRESDDCCRHDHADPSTEKNSVFARAGRAVSYGLFKLPREIGGELLLGIAMASALLVWDPLKDWLRENLSGWTGYAFVLIFGLGTYVCSTASVPMADAFIKSGLTGGQAMTYLLVGPITSYGALIVLRKEFGGRVLAMYLAVISGLSVAFGWLFEALSAYK